MTPEQQKILEQQILNIQKEEENSKITLETNDNLLQENIENTDIKVNILSKNKKFIAIICGIIILVSITFLGLKAKANSKPQESQVSQIPEVDKSKLEKVNEEEKLKRNQVENEVAKKAATEQQSYQSPITFDASQNKLDNTTQNSVVPSNINITATSIPAPTIQPMPAVVVQNTEQEQKLDEKLKEGILGQAQNIINSQAGGYTKQIYSKSNYNTQNQNIQNLQINQNNLNNIPTLTQNINKNLVFKAGDVMYATLINGINTDDGTQNILATLYGGKYNGSTLIGNINIENKNISLKFNILSPKDRSKKSININAIAIRAEDARNGIAEKIDNHVIERYSYLFASSMLKAIGNAAKGVSNTIIGLGGTVINTTEQANSNQQIIKQGLGEVGNNMSGEIGKNFNRLPTYSVPAGSSIGIIFTSDIEE